MTAAKPTKVVVEEVVVEEVAVEEVEVEVAEVESLAGRSVPYIEEAKPYFDEPQEVNEEKRVVQRVKYAQALREGTNPQLKWGTALSSIDRAEVQAEVAKLVAEENA